MAELQARLLQQSAAPARVDIEVQSRCVLLQEEVHGLRLSLQVGAAPGLVQESLRLWRQGRWPGRAGTNNQKWPNSPYSLWFRESRVKFPLEPLGIGSDCQCLEDVNE